MKKKIFFNKVKKLFQYKKNIDEETKLSEIQFDSLKLLELIAFNDTNFKNLKVSGDQIYKCRNFGQLIKLYKKNIS